MTKKAILWLAVVCLAVVPLTVAATLAVAPLALHGKQQPGVPGKTVHEEENDDDPGEGLAPTVKTIRPKRDASFVISVDEPAYVEPYYRSDLMARVAGPVNAMHKDVGNP